MRNRTAIGLSIVIAAGAATAANASTLTIDDFSITQDVGFQPIGGIIESSSEAGPDASILGNFRDLAVINSNADNIIESRGMVSDGTLAFSNNAGTTSTLRVIYDGDDDNFTGVDIAPGLGGIDLTENDGMTLDALCLDILSADLAGLSVTISVFDSSNDSSSIIRVYPTAINAPITETFAYADFLGSADFTDVSAVVLQFSGPAEIDASFDNFKAVPTPGAVSLLALGGFAAARRRRA